MKSVLTKSQFKLFGPRYYSENGTRYRITAKVRYDDDCGNGHNSFAITADIERSSGNRWLDNAGGCCHDEIAKHFPELKKYIKWHLCSSEGPMHYLGNTLYHAGERDCWGAKKGEPRQWEKSISFSNFPVSFKFSKAFIEWIEKPENRNKAHYGFSLEEVQHKDNDKVGSYKFAPKYTFKGFKCEWHECPFDNKEEAEQFKEAFKLPFSIGETPTAWGEGKEAELENARACAIWPDATLEQLRDKEALEARLPKLLEDFKKDVEELGFVF